MKKHDFDDDEMSPKAWDALIKKGMVKVKRQYALKKLPMHHIENGQIIAVPRRVEAVKAVASKSRKSSVKIISSETTGIGNLIENDK